MTSTDLPWGAKGDRRHERNRPGSLHDDVAVPRRALHVDDELLMNDTSPLVDLDRHMHCVLTIGITGEIQLL